MDGVVVYYRPTMALDARVRNIAAGTAVVQIEGPLTLGTNLKIVDAVVQQAVGGGVSRIVLDLEKCPYLDSAGLGFLVHTNGLVLAQGGAMRLCRVGPRVMALLRMTKMDGILSCDSDEETALENLAEIFGAASRVPRGAFR